jgi:hypothetical protein
MNLKVALEIAAMNIGSNRLTGGDLSDEQVVKGVGFRDLNEYWRVELSEPMEISKFKQRLKRHFFNPQCTLDLYKLGPGDRLDTPQRSDDLYNFDFDGAIKLAVQLDEKWILKIPGKDTKDWMLHPREAALWLLSMPKRRHLVPGSLRTFIEGERKKPEAAAKPNLSVAEMRAFMTEEEKRLGKAPGQTELEETLRRKFPDHKVNRTQLRNLHRERYNMKPGPRKKNYAE